MRQWASVIYPLKAGNNVISKGDTAILEALGLPGCKLWVVGYICIFL